ncbi:peptidase M4 [Zhongshania marina]|uniref:Peptidase M4 n=2 Tax=Zhongshania marina TaxID=2304603 RepID=A0A2S4HE56_9GAMM|nr:peptidase M4 [Marortus luteolus]
MTTRKENIMKIRKKHAIVSTAFTGLLFSGIVLADKEDIHLLEQTKISLTEAITIAENKQKGRAYEASLDDDSFSPRYEIGVIAADKIYELEVDGVSGEVLGVREDMD